MNLKRTVRTFIESDLAGAEFNGNIRDDESLLELAILDSLAILTLLSFMDEQFGILPTEEELLPENFETINKIEKYIKSKLTP